MKHVKIILGQSGIKRRSIRTVVSRILSISCTPHRTNMMKYTKSIKHNVMDEVIRFSLSLRLNFIPEKNMYAIKSGTGFITHDPKLNILAVKALKTSEYAEGPENDCTNVPLAASVFIVAT